MSNVDIKDLANSLDPKIVEKAKECKSPEELLQLAEDEGIELPDELLGSVAGGQLDGAKAIVDTVVDMFHTVGAC